MDFFGFQKRKRKNDEKPKRGRGSEFKVNWTLAALVVIVSIAAVLLGRVVNYEVFFIPAPGDAPVVSTGLPPVIPSPAPVATTEYFWAKDQFLTRDEAAVLRTLPNVVNFAVLQSNGSVKYAATVSYVLNKEAGWQPANVVPTGFGAMSILGTAVTLSINNQLYTLNLYQPFTVQNSANQDFIYLVDSTRLWVVDAKSATKLSLADVVSKLPTQLAINQKLSFTY